MFASCAPLLLYLRACVTLRIVRTSGREKRTQTQQQTESSDKEETNDGVGSRDRMNESGKWSEEKENAFFSPSLSRACGKNTSSDLRTIEYE